MARFANRFESLLFFLPVLMSSWLVGGGVAAPPNIVFIMADDMGWSDTSNVRTNMGNCSDFYETPALERLALTGMSFTNAYTNGANCAPTRAALLTGQYAQRQTNNVYHVNSLNRGGKQTMLIGPPQGLPNGVDAIPEQAYTFAEHLRDQTGYLTAHFGKFHVTDVGDAGAALIESAHGFSTNFGGTTSGHPDNYYARGNRFGKPIGPALDRFAEPYSQEYVEKNLRPFSVGVREDALVRLVGSAKHVTDAMTDAAIEFMERAKQQPFLVQFHPYAVHTPIGAKQARLDLLDKYSRKQPGEEDSHRSFAAILEGLDQSVARIVDYLKSTPDPHHPGNMLAENTILFFYSDNGGKLEQSNNGPLRGQKGELTEGGVRVPLIAWSGNDKLVDRGTINATPVIGIDFYKTFASIAGAGDPENMPLDGADLSEILADANASLGREAIFWHFPGYLDDQPQTRDDSGRNQRPQSVIRAGDWKLTYNYEDQSYELYNLRSDISESHNVVEQQPEVAARLSTKLISWLAELDSPLATLRQGELKLSCRTTYYANRQSRHGKGEMVIKTGEEVPILGFAH